MRYLLVCLCLLICLGCDEQKPRAKKRPVAKTLLAFQAEWCAPCRGMESTLKALEADGYRIKRIDYDANPTLVTKYRVQSLPTYVAVRKGREVGRVVGATSKEKLSDLLD